MCRFTLAVFVVFGALLACGEDRKLLTGTNSGPPTGPLLGPPLEKPATEQTAFAQVLFTLKQDGRVVKGGSVELDYGEFGVMGLTDDQGQITFNCSPGNHRARAWKGDELIGSWSIIIKTGYRSEIELSIGKAAVIIRLVKLPPRPSYTPLPENATEGSTSGSW